MGLVLFTPTKMIVPRNLNPEYAAICIGDSFTIGDFGYDDSAATIPLTPFPTLLAAALEREVLNRGVGGTTTSTISSSYVSYATTRDSRRSVVIMGCGTNDLNNGAPSSLATPINNVLAVLTRSPSRFILWGPFAGTDFTVTQTTNIEAIRAWFEATYPTYWIDMRDFHMTGNVVDEAYRRYNSVAVRDTLHPNTAFYTEVANRMAAQIISEAWIDAPTVRTMRETIAPSSISLALQDGPTLRTLTASVSSLSGTDQTRLSSARDHVSSSVSGLGTLQSITYEQYVDQLGANRWAARAVLDDSGNRVDQRVTDFSVAVTSSINLFAASVVAPA